MKAFVFSFMLLCATLFCTAQSSELYYSKGKAFYDKNQYREALYYFKKYLALDTTRGEVYKWRGNCYFDLNQLDSAVHDYEAALRRSPAMHEIHYNLSGIHYERKQYEQARSSLRKYLKAEPEDVDGLIRMAHLNRQLDNDSSLYFIQKAYSIDPAHIRVANALAWEYFNLQWYAEAKAVASKSRAKFPHDQELLQVEAYASFASGDFTTSARLADSLIALSRDPISFYVLKAKSEILRHTDSTAIERNSFNLHFREINAANIANLDNWAGTPSHPYAYETLLKKYRQHEPLGLDEYFMVYYGYTTDKRYAPYFSNDDHLQETMEEENYEEVIKECQSLLVQDEFNPRVLEYLFMAQFASGRTDDFQITLKQYLGIMEGLLATGTAEAFESAIIVTSPKHEYDVLNYLGLQSNGQSLMRSNGHDFDVLSVKDENGTKEYYFNIDKPFRSLGTMFNNSNSKPSKKKRKQQT